MVRFVDNVSYVILNMYHFLGTQHTQPQTQQFNNKVHQIPQQPQQSIRAQPPPPQQSQQFAPKQRQVNPVMQKNNYTLNIIQY